MLCFFTEKVDFFDSSSKPIKNAIVFGDFQHQNFKFKQNEYDIRNQHKKWNRTTQFLLQNIFRQHSIPTPLLSIFCNNFVYGPLGRNFHEKYFVIETM